MSAARFVGRSTARAVAPVRQAAANQPSSRQRRARRRRVPARPRQRVRPQRRARAARAPARAAMVGTAGTNVSDCAWDYAACLMNPFDGPLACYPDSFALPSSRFRVRKVFDLKTGNSAASGSGYGFICFDPIAGCNNNSDCVYLTDGVYTADLFTTSTGGGVSSGKLGTGMFATTDYGTTSNQFRVVAAGIRIWYTGALQDCAGQILTYEAPDHQSLQNIGWGDLTARPGVHLVPVRAGQKSTVRSSGPKNPTERDYSISTVASGNLGPWLGIMLSGPTGLTFTAEVSLVYEIVGKQNQNPMPAKQDAVGLSHVNTVINSLGPQGFSNIFKDVDIWPRLISGASSVAKVALGMSAAAATPAVAGILSQLRTPGLGVLPRVLM